MLNSGNFATRVEAYSLIELIITIVLSSIVLVIFYSIFAPNQRASVSPVMQVKAAELGQAYLEEISLKRYDENSPAGNALRCNAATAPVCSATLGPNSETRIQFDDIDDYHGLNEMPPRDAFGTIRSGFSGFRVQVAVTYAGADFSLATQDLKKIVVTVTLPQAVGGQFVFSQYKGNF